MIRIPIAIFPPQLPLNIGLQTWTVTVGLLTAMDIVGECLSLVPVPGLSAVFIIFKFIVSTIQQAQSSKQQLQALAHTLGDLLQALNSTEAVSASHLDALRRLLDEISAFVHKHASYGFLKAIYTTDRRIAQIEAYQSRIAALINASQITALLRIQNAQAMNEAARARDQQALIDRLSALEANHARLAENLNVHPGNIQAIMASIDSNLGQTMGDPERHFLSYALQYLRTSSGTQVAREAWTITSYDVDIGQRIGSGGYGEVFKAIWNLVEVAVKIFRNDNGIVPPTSASIRREIQLWSKLRHPHLLQFLGANILDDKPFIVMPLFNNGNALDYLELHPNCNRISILHQMSLGLVHLHAHNIVHGDLKAANVLIDDSGKAVLCDFGLSRVISNITSRSTVADSSLCAGSRNWMSPERLSGESLRKPADIYAFGMTIFEIYATEVPLGDVPYAEFTDLVVRRNVRPERPHAEDAPQLSDDIWRLAEDCWVRDPLGRPTAAVLCTTIGQLVDSTPNPAPRNISKDAGSEGDAIGDITTLVARFRTVISPPLPLDADIIWLLLELENHGRASDLDFCITYWSEAIELLYNDPLRKAYAFLGLGASQFVLGRLRSDLPGLDTSILTLQRAIELFTTKNQHKADACLALGAAQLGRFVLCSDQPDLDSSISNIQRALDFYPINCPNAGIAYISLCAGKFHQYRLHPNQFDPTASVVSIIEKAFELLPEGHPYRPSVLHLLANFNLLQFQRSRELLHLDASISNTRKAAQLSFQKKPELLGELGVLYLYRYRLRKETPDLDAAISNLCKATENNDVQAWHSFSMGSACQERFKLYQELPDIDRAISHVRNATERYTESDPMRIDAFLTLGVSFLDRYNLRHLQPDSDASISNLQKAVEICPDNHDLRAAVFYWLGWSHFRRFHLLRRVPGVDSEAAVANLERAVASSQPSNPEHMKYVEALAQAKEAHSPSLANQVWNGFRGFMFNVEYN